MSAAAGDDPVTTPLDPPGRPPAGRTEVDAFRQVVSHFASGVTVVTTVADGVDHAMTASAFTSVSLEPLMVLVCVHKEARFHDAVLLTGTWGVSLLDASGRRAAQWFATKGRPLIGQLDRYPHHRGPVTGAPLLDPALAWLECRTVAVHDGGDHDIVVGEVVGVDLGGPDADPLVYYRGGYRQLG
jgi:flavin reductase (DIM6/NTAB) family NADH-FMN oxidoreductase RutF